MIVIINGQGGIGKDTLIENYQLDHPDCCIWNISSIDPIKNVARQLGWAGTKADKDRKFLSDLKNTSSAYNNYPTRYLFQKTEEFFNSGADILFIHIREPAEIDKYIKRYPAYTVLVRGKNERTFHNPADDEVEHYNYDYYFANDGSIESGIKEFELLMQKIWEESRK